MLRWVREIPIEGSPADVMNLVLANQNVIADSLLPKLLLTANRGAVITACGTDAVDVVTRGQLA